jgi:hypothetical protein
MTNREVHEANPISTSPVATKEHFIDVVLPALPQFRTGLQNALKMLQDSQQPPGDYMVVLTTSGEPLPGMFVAAGEPNGLRLFLAKKLEAHFPELKMGTDIFSMPVTLGK